MTEERRIQCEVGTDYIVKAVGDQNAYDESKTIDFRITDVKINGIWSPLKKVIRPKNEKTAYHVVLQTSELPHVRLPISEIPHLKEYTMETRRQGIRHRCVLTIQTPPTWRKPGETVDTKYEIYCTKGNDYTVKVQGLADHYCDMYDDNVPIKFRITHVLVNDRLCPVEDVIDKEVFFKTKNYTFNYQYRMSMAGLDNVYPRYSIMVPLKQIDEQQEHTCEYGHSGTLHKFTMTIQTPKYWKHPSYWKEKAEEAEETTPEPENDNDYTVKDLEGYTLLTILRDCCKYYYKRVTDKDGKQSVRILQYQYLMKPNIIKRLPEDSQTYQLLSNQYPDIHTK